MESCPNCGSKMVNGICSNFDCAIGSEESTKIVAKKPYTKLGI